VVNVFYRIVRYKTFSTLLRRGSSVTCDNGTGVEIKLLKQKFPSSAVCHPLPQIRIIVSGLYKWWICIHFLYFTALLHLFLYKKLPNTEWAHSLTCYVRTRRLLQNVTLLFVTWKYMHFIRIITLHMHEEAFLRNLFYFSIWTSYSVFITVCSEAGDCNRKLLQMTIELP
jgi:hypothetical protein